MSQQYIPLYNDNVVKISIKQGEESDRFDSLSATITSTEYDITSTLPGAFTMGELAYTRDTNRVFAGNFTNENEFLRDDEGNIKIQQTVGGSLVGNKYLGYIDSKPPLNYTLNNDRLNGIPLNLTELNELTNYNNIEISIPGLLTKDSQFRSYEYTTEGTTCKKTEDSLWSRQSFYNSKYDAYDGDFMYDRYRNAIILFDHTIKPSYTGDINFRNNTWNINWVDGEPSAAEIATDRKRTPIIPWVGDREENSIDPSANIVYEFSKDMYGDGYMLFYNLLPDGDTITFIPRNFNSVDGNPDGKPNFNYNIFTVKNIYPDNLRTALDEKYFKFDTVISLQPIIELAGITTTANSSLSLPSDITISNRYRIVFSQFEDIAPSDEYSLVFTPSADNDNSFVATLVSSVQKESTLPTYKIELGNGLVTQTGESYFVLDKNHTKGSILLKENSESGQYNSLTNNPYDISTDEVTLSESYSGNLIYNTSGQVSGENGFSNDYTDAAEDFINQFDNTNTKINYFNSPIPITNISGSISNISLKYKISPVVYCCNPPTNTNIKAIGPSSATGNIVIAGKDTLSVDDLKSLWVTGTNNLINPPAEYINKTTPSIYVSSLLNQEANALNAGIYINEDKTLNILRPTNTITITKGNDEFTISGDGIDTITGIKEIGIPSLGYTLTTINEIAEVLDYTNKTDNSITILDYHSNNSILREKYMIIEAAIENTIYAIQIPITPYLFKLKNEDNTVIVDGENIVGVNTINVYPINTNASSELTPAYNYCNNTIGYISLTDNNNIPYGIIEFITDTDTVTKYVGNDLYLSRSSQGVGGTTNPYIWSEEIELSYYPQSSNFTAFENIPGITEYTEYIINSYYVSNEIDITDVFDSWALYYENELEEEYLEQVTEAGGEEAWKNKLRLMFPVVPLHATSVLLRCKTGANALTISYTGNNKTYNYEGETTAATAAITGLNLPFDLLAQTNWLKNRNLIVVPANSDEIVEIPIAIDESNNKHFSFAVSGNASSTIYIVGYKA